ncbi:MAG TPA: hypothetical protein VK452_06575 [Dissulfurispiraceae bacterium]|nr:hypothetical protein [Dissulfurispiraceae bacterium]
MGKNKYGIFLVFVLFTAIGLLFGLLDETRSEEKEINESKHRAMSAQESFSAEKRDFMEKARIQLDKIDKQVRELEIRMERQGAEVSAAIVQKLKELKAKRTTVKSELEKLETVSKQKWSAAKKKFTVAIDELKDLYEKASSKASAK